MAVVEDESNASTEVEEVEEVEEKVDVIAGAIDFDEDATNTK